MIALLTLLAVSSVPVDMVGIVGQSHNYKTWIYPATIYNLKLFIAFLIVFAFVYFIFRRPLVITFNRFSSYLRIHSTLAVIVCGVLYWVPFGLIIQALDYYDSGQFDGDWVYIIFVLSIFLGSIILLAYGRFRNKVLISPLFLKVSSAVVLSVICASMMFIILNEAGILNIDNCTYYGNKHGHIYIYPTNPFGSVISIWKYPVYSNWLIIYSLIILWTGNAYRWLKTKIGKNRLTKKLKSPTIE